MNENQGFWIALAFSFVAAYLGWSAPMYRMPIDYGAMISRSIPLAVVWCLLFAVCVWRYKKRGFWLLLGAPIALYWPVWLLFNHFPSCYYAGNCV